jgi:hypothetical protein
VAVGKIIPTIERLAQEYGLERERITLVGGGGASALVAGLRGGCPPRTASTPDCTCTHARVPWPRPLLTPLQTPPPPAVRLHLCRLSLILLSQRPNRNLPPRKRCISRLSISRSVTRSRPRRARKALSLTYIRRPAIYSSTNPGESKTYHVSWGSVTKINGKEAADVVAKQAARSGQGPGYSQSATEDWKGESGKKILESYNGPAATALKANGWKAGETDKDGATRFTHSKMGNTLPLRARGRPRASGSTGECRGAARANLPRRTACESLGASRTRCRSRRRRQPPLRAGPSARWLSDPRSQYSQNGPDPCPSPGLLRYHIRRVSPS